eukprot:scaffold2875_cov247-Pinguiococcus_pyrenoidosus.AAC.19
MRKAVLCGGASPLRCCFAQVSRLRSPRLRPVRIPAPVRAAASLEKATQILRRVTRAEFEAVGKRRYRVQSWTGTLPAKKLYEEAARRALKGYRYQAHRLSLVRRPGSN